MTSTRGAAPATIGEPARDRVELSIGGMTCASCASRVEQALNRIDGVTATVNYATERASVRTAADIAPEQLVTAVRQAGYTATLPRPARGDADASAGTLGALRRRVLLSSALSAPVVAMAMIPALQLPYWQWVSLALTTPVVLWAGWPFHRAAVASLRHGSATMDTLISMGTLTAFGWSVYALLLGGAGDIGLTHPFELTPTPGHGASQVYFEVAAGVTTFVLAGRFFEARAKRRAGAALRALLELGAKDVAVLTGGTERRVPVEQLAVGDRFVVRPGEKVATDGIVEEGSSALDTATLTGEPVPVDVGPGDAVVGGTVDVGGRLVVRATAVGTDTQLAQLGRLVEQAQTGKAAAQRLADRISAVFVPIVILLAAATLAFWLAANGDVAFAVTAAVAVLIIACPCALGLATPTALLVGTGRGAQLGILIRGPEVLESTRRVDTVLLDKTGTVTTGAMALDDVLAADGENPAEVLRLAGAVQDASEHPVARAVAAAARSRFEPLPGVEDFAAVHGLGVAGRVEGRTVTVGRPALLAQRSMPLPSELAGSAAAAQAGGRTVVAVGWDGRARGVLTVADTVKPSSATAVAELRAHGLHPVLLTGDNPAAASAVARQVGIDDVVAGVLPVGKVDVVRRLQAEGRVVAMVGDGVNDAAALATADLGLAMGTGTDAAIEASDLTLVRGDLRAAADAIRLSRRTLAVIRGNLFWAFAYNVAALPLAAAGLLNPMIAGAAMALSSVFVVSNSLRLRRFAPSKYPA